LSRSLAAFAIANLAKITPPQAAHSIINGGDDNGMVLMQFILIGLITSFG
jgi:hypothetical protein